MDLKLEIQKEHKEIREILIRLNKKLNIRLGDFYSYNDCLKRLTPEKKIIFKLAIKRYGWDFLDAFRRVCEGKDEMFFQKNHYIPIAQEMKKKWRK